MNRIMRVLSVQGVSIVGLLAMAGCAKAPEPQAAAPVTAVVYEGATLLAGDGLTPVENGLLVVDQGRIVAVGAAGAVTAPAGAAHVDLKGKTVIPAIIDGHTHLSTNRDALLLDLKRRAFFGVAAALSLGTDGDGTPLEVRDEVIPGSARYRSAGLGITAPEPGRNPVHWVTTEEEARAAVQAEIARKADFIKVWVDDRDGKYKKLSPALYRAVIDEAHKAGLKTAAHIFALDDAKELLRAGIDIFAHGVRDRDIDDEFIAMVKARPNVVLIPNMGARGVVADLGWLSGALPAEALAKLQETNQDQPPLQKAYAIQARNLKKLSDAGMTIGFGTDGNTPWGPYVEMEDMVIAGMTPAQVLVSATRNSAAISGFTDQGTLAAGKSADFVVLDANPLEDIMNARKIADVYLRGVKVERGAYP
jgi:imidazolonepropionase-like amidohydrolase